MLHTIAQQQKSYIKDTTDFINLIEKTELQKGVILVSMDVTSFYTNIPQEGGINIVCTAYKTFYSDRLPIPKCLLEKAPRLVLQENSFQFNKHKEPLRALRWSYPLPIFPWGKSKSKTLTKALTNYWLGNVLLTTLSPCGTFSISM